MESSSIPLISCPLHPHENIQRIDLELGAQQEFYCIECLLDAENPLQISPNLKTIKEFLNHASKYYETNSKPVENTQEIPDEYSDLLLTQNEIIEKLVSHIEEEKKRMQLRFDDVTKYLLTVVSQKRDEYFNLLDRQLFNFRYGFIFFEKQLKKMYPKSEDGYSLYPTKEELFEKISKIQNSTQLMAYVKNIKEDLNENKLLESGEDLKLTDEEARKLLISKTAKKLIECKVKSPSIVNVDIDLNKIKSDFQKTISKLFDEIFELKDEIEDVTSSETYPKSSLLKGNDFEMIRKWLEKDFSTKKMKLIYRGTKDGMTAQNFHKNCDNKGATIIVMKSKTYGKIFGGFVDQAFTSKGGYINSTKTFLFSVTNKAKYELIDKNNHAQYGAYDNASYGPTFGGGHDIYLNANFGSGNSSVNRYSYNFPDANALVGSNQFIVEEIEVFSLAK